MIILYPPAYNVTFLGNNPLYTELAWSALDQAPHALTPRGSYTVPAGRRAIVTAIHAYMRRSAAAAPVGLAQVYFALNMGGTAYYICEALFNNNTVDFVDRLVNPAAYNIYQGDILQMQSFDLSTGGTITYYAHAAIVEVDI